MASLQETLAGMESGALARWIQRALLLIVAAALIIYSTLFSFFTFDTEDGFDQAQIARQIATGEGFSTKVIRPLALHFLIQKERPYKGEGPMPELSQAPLNPYLMSMVYFFVDEPMEVTTQRILLADRLVVVLHGVLLILAIAGTYILGRLLFDEMLGILSATIVLFCGLFWEFTQSALPQIPLTFLFVVALLFLAKATQDEVEGRMPILWLVLSGLTMGLMTLAHGTAFWIFLGALVFCAIFFRQRVLLAPAFLVSYAAVAVILVIVNFNTSGTPTGMAWLSVVEGAPHSRDYWEGEYKPDWDIVKTTIDRKIGFEFRNQFENLFQNLGLNIVAPIFFLSLLHPFKRRDTGAMKWAVLTMFVALLIGMSFFSHDAAGVDIGQLHSLFIPVFVIYGLAFLIVLWNRGAPPIPLLRVLAMGLLLGICAVPLILKVAAPTNPGHAWPPYFYLILTADPEEPGASLAEFVPEDRSILTDIPEAVAHHSNRVAVQAPNDFRLAVQFIELGNTDYSHTSIAAAYFTPVTGDRKFVTDQFGTRSGQAWLRFNQRWYEMLTARTLEARRAAQDTSNFMALDLMIPFPPANQTVLIADQWTLEQRREAGELERLDRDYEGIDRTDSLEEVGSLLSPDADEPSPGDSLEAPEDDE